MCSNKLLTHLQSIQNSHLKNTNLLLIYKLKNWASQYSNPKFKRICISNSIPKFTFFKNYIWKVHIYIYNSFSNLSLPITICLQLRFINRFHCKMYNKFRISLRKCSNSKFTFFKNYIWKVHIYFQFIFKFTTTNYYLPSN